MSKAAKRKVETVQPEKISRLARVIGVAISKQLDKEPMRAFEVQLALTEVIYSVGVAAEEITKRKGVHGGERVAA